MPPWFGALTAMARASLVSDVVSIGQGDGMRTKRREKRREEKRGEEKKSQSVGSVRCDGGGCRRVMREGQR